MHGTNNEPQTQPATRDPNLQDIKTKINENVNQECGVQGREKKKNKNFLY